jgi:hypothetical protein
MGGIAWFGIPMGIATSMGLAAVALQNQGLITLTPAEISAGLPAVKGTSDTTTAMLMISRRRPHGIFWWTRHALLALLGSHFCRLDRTSCRLEYPHIRHLCHLFQQEPYGEADFVDQSSYYRHVLCRHGRYRYRFQLYWCLHGIPLRPHGRSPNPLQKA